MLPLDSATLHPGYYPNVARMERSGIREQYLHWPVIRSRDGGTGRRARLKIWYG